MFWIKTAQYRMGLTEYQRFTRVSGLSIWHAHVIFCKTQKYTWALNELPVWAFYFIIQCHYPDLKVPCVPCVPPTTAWLDGLATAVHANLAVKYLNLSLKVPSGQIGSTWEWYHWIGLEKDINHYSFWFFNFHLEYLKRLQSSEPLHAKLNPTSCLFGSGFA